MVGLQVEGMHSKEEVVHEMHQRERVERGMIGEAGEVAWVEEGGGVA